MGSKVLCQITSALIADLDVSTLGKNTRRKRRYRTNYVAAAARQTIQALKTTTASMPIMMSAATMPEQRRTGFYIMSRKAVTGATPLPLESEFPVTPLLGHLLILAYGVTSAEVELMRTTIKLILLLLILSPSDHGQTTQIEDGKDLNTSALDYRVARFDLTDSTLIEGLSKLSLEPIPGLHLGIEAVLQDKFSDPPDRSIRFSLSFEDATVRDIVETLCQLDRRYIWSTDGSSINIYPRETVGDSAYLLNRELVRIALTSIPNPDQALTPLAKLLPEEQLGYAGVGGDDSYPEPWRAVFDHLTSVSL